MNLGSTYPLSEDRALALYQRALAIFSKVLGPGHPKVASSLNNVGAAFYQRLAFDDAGRYFERASAVGEAALGPDHPNTAFYLANLGAALYEAGQYEPGLAASRRAVAILERISPTHGDLDEPLRVVGRIRLAEREPQQAIPILERALELADPSSTSLSGIKFALAQALTASGGDPKRARRLAQEARDGYQTTNREQTTPLNARDLAQAQGAGRCGPYRIRVANRLGSVVSAERDASTC